MPGGKGLFSIEQEIRHWTKTVVQDCPRGHLCKHYMENLEYSGLPGIQWHLTSHLLTSRSALGLCLTFPLFLPCIAAVPLLSPKPVLREHLQHVLGFDVFATCAFAVTLILCSHETAVSSQLACPQCDGEPACCFPNLFLYPNLTGTPACPSGAWEGNCALCSAFWSSVLTTHEEACAEMIIWTFTLHLKDF